ncbi:FAST kinase domain-containing protein 4 [Anabrus simplex]|uniref:FAST kinase domain-containing protein 4 n=1 Tax=Anabrus simplex TaxID=316456 RepID=UPI0034DD6D9D
MLRYISWRDGWRLLIRFNGQVLPASSSSPSAIGLSLTPCSELSEESQMTNLSSEDSRSSSNIESPSTKENHLLEKKDSPSVRTYPRKGKQSTLVASAFASIQAAQTEPKNRSSYLDEQIAAAKTVNTLLSVSKSSHITRTHALKIVSILADWAAAKRVKLADFESDPRFIKLCHLLGRHASTSPDDASVLGDLATVLGVTGDDEAAKLVSSISLSQMIRVMTALAQKKRRSTPLLRALSSNISSSMNILNMKQGADVLYAMAVLNFPDDVLLEKISADLCHGLADNDRPAVVGSVLTSLGIMRYKDVVLLDALCDWVEKNHSVCRVHDLVALLLTLANVNHQPANGDSLFKVVLPQVSISDVPRAAAWLDLVWALTVLGRAEHSHLESVLSPEAVERLVVTNGDNNGNGIPPAARIKLLNINAAAKHNTSGYKGPFLTSDSTLLKVTLSRSKEKQLLVSSVVDSLSNLLPSSTYLRTNIETDMGFLIDGECVLDSNCNPLPVEEQSLNKKITPKKGIRVAVLVWDYHDMCRGRQEPIGAAVLSSQLLEKKGYKVLTVPYTEFNPREKVVTRVQYLEHRLKSLVRSALC